MSKARYIPPAEAHVLLEDRLREENRDDLADVLKACRVPFTLVCVCCREKIETTKGCGKRWCPVCARKVTAARYNRIEPIARSMQWPLAVMLSKKNPRDIEGCVADLKKAFKGFRRTKFWKNTVRGGFVGFEITHNHGTPHIHLHALIDCEWLAIATPKLAKGHTKAEIARLCKMAQAELSAVWAGYLGQKEAVVWVRRADKKALAETIKYPMKPAELLNMKCKASAIIDELDRGRLVARFGHCHAAHVEFLGRGEVIEVEKLCKGCSTDRSIVPEATYNRFWDDITIAQINSSRGERSQKVFGGLSPRHLALMDSRLGWSKGSPPMIQGNQPDASIPW